MTDRRPGAPGRYQAMFTDGELAGKEFTVTLRRDDAPIAEGTPYNKANVLPDALASQLCPGMEDPAPKDAFAALQTGKADTGRSAIGEKITLQDAADASVMGLKIYGRGRENGCVGDKGSVTVKMMGKNLVDYREAYARDAAGQTVTVDESINGLYWTGNYFFKIPVSIPAGTTVFLSYKTESVNGDYVAEYSYCKMFYVDGTSVVFYAGEPFTLAKDSAHINIYKSESETIHDTKVWDIQLEIGNTATDYEPYREPQTITVPTPGGLEGDVLMQDEVDFAKGVLIRRVFENTETPLPADVLEAYAKLRTYAQTTIITNDEEADMAVRYCTDTTAVPMVYGPEHRKKLLAIDENGCVSPDMAAAYVEHRENSDGWKCLVWSDGFAQLHLADTSCAGFYDGTYDPLFVLPLPVRSDAMVQVTIPGKAFLSDYTLADGTDLRLQIEALDANAGLQLSCIHIYVAGYIAG